VRNRPVRTDHYSILGVTQASEDVVIRAAYHALMRRYHPDADPSEEAAERSRAINEAYAVLRDREKRARYDATLSSRDLTFDPAAHPAPTMPRRSRLGPATAIAFALLAVAMVAFAVTPPIAGLPSLKLPFGAEDRPANAVQQARSKPAAQVPKQSASLCADSAAANLIKQELFRRAAEIRGIDEELLGRAVRDSVVRVEPSTKSAREAGSDCAGWVGLDLPPGLAVDGERTNINAEVAYGLAGESRALRLASLSGADRIVRTLSSLGPAPKEPDQDEQIEPVRVATVVRKLPKPTAPSVRPDTQPLQAAPVTSGCGRLTSRTDQMICASGNLSSLDRQLTLLYRQSWNQADEKKRAALLGSRQRFNDRREACSSPNCMTTAYLSRLKEISDIMAGRAQR
jgi:uncharacterized protein YecT (DUF1311 family)